MTPRDQEPVAAPSGEALIRALVVDDESFNRRRLEDLLKRTAGVTLVGMAEDGFEAVDAIRALKPDLVFLDVHMPEKSGLDVLREIGVAAMPATIFVTAYDAYAVQAFDLSAIDYLVKPFDDERFEQAMSKARRSLAFDGMSALRGQLLALLDANRLNPDVRDARVATPPRGAARYLDRIAVEINGVARPVAVESIEYITPDGPYAELHVAGRRYLIREAMQTLEERLDPQHFMRVHRSVIVRLALVEGFERVPGGDGEVQLRGGKRLRVSRTRREPLERWLGLLR